MHYGGAIAALIVAWWLLKGIDAGVQQAKEEVRRFREEYKVFRKEVRETVDRGTRAGMSAMGAAQAAWRAMKGAPRGAGEYARKTAAGTGPAGRVFRAARAGGRLGASAARGAKNSARRAGWRLRGPRIGMCEGGCGLPALLSALTKLADGRRVCRQCAADMARPSPAASPPAAVGARPAGTVPAAAIPAPAPQAPGAGSAEAPARSAVPVPTPAAPEPVRLAPAAPAAAAGAPPAPSLPSPAAPQAAAAPMPRFLAPPDRATAPAPVQPPAATALPQGTAPSTSNGERTVTTPNSLPAARRQALPAGGANGGEAYNHGQFLATARGLRADAAAIKGQQDGMLGNLYSVNGRDQVRDITEWSGQADRYADAVTDMTDTVDPPEQRLIGAIANAGGPENIPDMTYFGS